LPFRYPTRWLAAALCLLAGVPAGAQVFVGTYGIASDPDHVRVFAAGAGGDVAPVRMLGGPATLLQAPDDFFLAESEGALYVADFMGQAIRVFAAAAQGDTAPLRNITSPSLGQPRDLVVVPAAGEVLAIASLCCVGTYNSGANGSVAAWRFLGGPLSQLDNPSGLAYRASGDEVYVGDYNGGGGEILVFPRTASGNTPPSRVITGPSTQLGAWVVSVAAHPVLPEVYALVMEQQPDFSFVSNIVTFNASASGDAVPLRVIGGDATLMGESSAFDYDARRDEFAVLGGGGSGMARVLTFRRTGVGNIAPIRILSGPSTGLDNHTALLAQAPDLIFGNGFQF
jgi:hypothetical protein